VIHVYIIPERGERHLGSGKRRDTTRSLFNNPCFDIVSDCDFYSDNYLKDFNYSLDGYSFNFDRQSDKSIFMLYLALLHSKEEYPEEYCLFVKDSSCSTANPQSIADIIRASLSEEYGGYLSSKGIRNEDGKENEERKSEERKSSSWDLLYLSKWHDLCTHYSNAYPIPNSNVSLVNTKSPNGLQAIVVSPSGRDKLLTSQTHDWEGNLNKSINESIYNGHMNAITCSPNCISYNPLLAVSNLDYYKSHECIPLDRKNNFLGENDQIQNMINIVPLNEMTAISSSGKNPPNSGSSVGTGVIIFIIVVIILILLAWALIRINRKK